MSEILRLSPIQADIKWEDKLYNLKTFESKIAQIKETDLIILPEMFNTGFSMNPQKTAESMEGETIKWMKKMAQNNNSAIIGSLAIKENEEYFNRLIFAFPDGNISFYDKKHLFVLSEEHLKFQSGNQTLIVNYLGWKIKTLICYDLRFPVWARNVEDYDLLIYIANWPATRREQWLALLRARAIENQSYTLGLNRVGKDKNNYEYSGDSLAINYFGEELYKAGHEEKTKTIIISKKQLKEARNYFPVLKDGDKFTYS